eukprot:gene10627-4939_t
MLGSIAFVLGACFTGGVRLVWNVDKSTEINTPAGILRGDRGIACPEERGPICNGYNGHAVNVYGNRGIMPRINADGTMVNGGIPQRGNLTLHLDSFNAAWVKMIPDAGWEGYCLLDYEFFRADWNSTPDVRHLLRPGCKLGYYGYPRNDLPTAAGNSPAFKQYCKEHPFDCSFAGYGNNTAGDAQRTINDNSLAWMWNAVDAVYPSIYFGLLPSQQNSSSPESNAIYVEQTVGEA